MCLCIQPEKAHQLKLRPMVELNRSRYATAFTQSIEAAHGVSTGVSAADRVQTVRCAPAGVLCELMNADGTMARGAQVAQFARMHALACTTVAEIAAYRRSVAWSGSGG